MNKYRILAIFALLFLIPETAFSTIIYESALLGQTGINGGAAIGPITSTNQFMLGSRFSISNNTQITAVGGHMSNSSLNNGLFDPNEKIYGAIVSLGSPSAFPSFLPSEIETNVLAVTTFIPGVILSSSRDLRVPLSVLLGPGDYALIFGTGLFSTNGSAAMPQNNPVLPNASFFLGTTDDFWNPLFIFNPLPIRFVVEGDVAPAVPEPSTLLLLVSGLAGLAAWRRRKAA